jgi:hypothetical protein
MWLVWQGYNNNDIFSVNVATYNIAGATPNQVSVVSLPVFTESTNASIILDGTGKTAYVSFFDGTLNNIYALDASTSTLIVAGNVFNATIDTSINMIPGPMDNLVMFGTNIAGNLPSVIVYESMSQVSVSTTPSPSTSPSVSVFVNVSSTANASYTASVSVSPSASGNVTEPAVHM